MGFVVWELLVAETSVPIFSSNAGRSWSARMSTNLLTELRLSLSVKYTLQHLIDIYLHAFYVWKSKLRLRGYYPSQAWNIEVISVGI